MCSSDLSVLVLGMMVLTGRAFQLQILESSRLQAEGAARQLRNVAVKPARGRILDRNGDVLAVGLPQGDVEASAAALEQRFAGITAALKQQEFKGKPGDQLVITPLGGGPQRLVVLGLGESDGIDEIAAGECQHPAGDRVVVNHPFIAQGDEDRVRHEPPPHR